MRRIALLTSLAVLLLAGVAQAATVNVINGRGFGHGVGMSQYGAYGYAKQGRDYKEILGHYYRGTEIGSAPSEPTRVLLQSSDPFIRVSGVTRGLGNRKLNPGRTYRIRPGFGGKLRVTVDGRGVGSFRGPIRFQGGTRGVRLGGRAINGLSSGRYRGRIEVSRGVRGGVTAINDLDIDSYVKGVVAAEMPSGWSTEALRSQAVAARSYALATSKAGSFDQYPDTRSQVYRGIAAETARSSAAVRDTRRQVVTYGGEVATTYFFSTSGGRTENVENSFLGSSSRPYLKSVKDPYDGLSPKHSWKLRFSDARLGAKLGVRGKLRRVKVLSRGKSPRIINARIYGSGGNRVLSGPQIRARLGLYDTWARFTRVSSKTAKPSKKRAAAASAIPKLSGGFSPAPTSRKLSLERLVKGRWKPAGTVRTTRGGAYEQPIGVAGTYRVRSGSVAGPAVRIGGR